MQSLVSEFRFTVFIFLWIILTAKATPSTTTHHTEGETGSHSGDSQTTSVESVPGTTETYPHTLPSVLTTVSPYPRNGTIRPIGYPDTYSPNTTYGWTVDCSGQGVRISYIKYNLTHALGCPTDYIQIKDGTGRLIGIFCGGSVEYTSDVIVSPSGYLEIQYRTTPYPELHGYGFELKWECTAAPSVMECRGCECSEGLCISTEKNGYVECVPAYFNNSGEVSLDRQPCSPGPVVKYLAFLPNTNHTTFTLKDSIDSNCAVDILHIFESGVPLVTIFGCHTTYLETTIRGNIFFTKMSTCLEPSTSLVINWDVSRNLNVNETLLCGSDPCSCGQCHVDFAGSELACGYPEEIATCNDDGHSGVITSLNYPEESNLQDTLSILIVPRHGFSAIQFSLTDVNTERSGKCDDQAIQLATKRPDSSIRNNFAYLCGELSEDSSQYITYEGIDDKQFSINAVAENEFTGKYRIEWKLLDTFDIDVPPVVCGDEDCVFDTQICYIVSDRQLMCSCNAQDDCSDESDEISCKYDPCYNGGVCTKPGTKDPCQCPSNYTGAKCLTDVDECDEKICNQPHGSCENTEGSYQCQCTVGFTGDHCENEIDRCMSEPCLHGATCTPSAELYFCVCTGDLQESIVRSLLNQLTC